MMNFIKRDTTNPSGETGKKRHRVLGDTMYRRLLLIALCIGFVSNMYSIFFLKNLLSVIGLFFQAIIMVSIFQKWKYQELLVKLWASMWIIAGIGGAISYLTAKTVPIPVQYGNLPTNSVRFAILLVSAFFITMGFYFYFSYGKNSDDIE
jgi:hypothetical protein